MVADIGCFGHNVSKATIATVYRYSKNAGSFGHFLPLTTTQGFSPGFSFFNFSLVLVPASSLRSDTSMGRLGGAPAPLGAGRKRQVEPPEGWVDCTVRFVVYQSSVIDGCGVHEIGQNVYSQC